MDRTLQRSLIGSTAAHVALLVLVIVLSGLAARKIIQPEIPVLELIPTNLKLTMGDHIGGGTPNPRPLAKTEGTPPPAPTPPQPTQVQPLPPKLVEKVAEPPKPVAKPDVTPDEPVKLAVPKVKVSTEPKTVAKAQDVDLTKKADKPLKHTETSEAAAPPKVHASTKKMTSTTADKRAEREAQEAEEAARAERAERLAAARSLAARLSGAASSVSKNVGGSTEIEMPGPGGAAYAPYLSWLQRFVEQQWRKPATTSQAAEVTLDVEIARDGTVLRAEVSHSSGIAALDRSATEVFRRNRKLQPLPDEYKEATLSVPVKFVLTP